MELFFKIQLVKNVLVYAFGVFTLSFCLNLFLPFICMSCPLKVFKFDAGILRDSCAVSLLKTLSRLPQSVAFFCPILFLMFSCNNYLFPSFATMIYWTSTGVLLNLVAPLDSALSSLDFEQMNVF